MGKIAVILASACVLLFLWCSYLQKENTRLYAEKKAFSDGIVKFNQARKKSDDTIIQIREKIRYVNEPCDCYSAPIPDDIIKLVRGQ